MALGGALGLGLVARDAAALCVAGAAQTWQVWHKLTSTIVLRGRHGTNSHLTIVLRGRRGTDGTGWRAWSWFSRP